MEIAVITISDRASRGEYEDLSGPVIVKIINESDVEAKLNTTIVPDERFAIEKALLENIGKDYILTTGGTGISPRDITPEVTEKLCHRSLPGVAEMLRRESCKETKFAVFSRGYAGVRDNTIIVNFPGSVKAVTFCTKLMVPLLEHGIKMLLGKGH
ncbi:MAG: MogA/MoaB family molybdenum cofactor biosynthesis protein [bacterium]|nr:MogA/MoaB family molybdenum cofactor biosynthesis protein [bacterium]